MPRTATSLFILWAGATLSACGSKPNVWLVEVNTARGDGAVCENTLTENIIGSVDMDPGGGSGPFDESRSSEGSNFLFYVKLLDLGDGMGSLNSGDLLLPGKETDEGWVFAWTESDADESARSHSGGYAYSQRFADENTTRLRLTFDSDTEAKGAFTISQSSTYSATETDEWGDEVTDDMGRYGSMYWYSGGDPVQNRGNQADCEASTCEVAATSACTATAPLTARRTDLKDDDDFSALVGLAAYGSFKTTGSTFWGGGFDSGR